MKRSMRTRAIFISGIAIMSTSLAFASVGAGASANGSRTAHATQCTTALPTKLPSKVGAIPSLPKSLRANYSMYPNLVAASPYIHFRSASKKPYTIGYSNSFSGNAWRAAALKTLKDDVAAYKKVGIVKSLIVDDSNGNNTVQIQQMRSMILQKVDVIIAIPGSADALNGVIQQAYKAGIPVITVAAPVTTPDAINLDVNAFEAGANMATGLATVLGGKGNIMTVEGISGTSGNATFMAGGNAVWARCPNIKVIADVIGQWSESVAKTAMIQALTTHSQHLNGVWQEGSMFMGITQALQQEGRSSMIPVTIGNPSQNSLAYWHQNAKKGYKTSGTANSPTGDMDASFRIAIRTLEGQGPKIATIVVKPPVITAANLAQWYRPTYTVNSTGVGVPPANSWLPNSQMNGFFAHPVTLPPTPGQ